MVSDILCIVLVLFFLIRGAFRGFFVEVFFLVGVIVAGFFAFTLYPVVGNGLFSVFHFSVTFWNVLSFVFLFVLILTAFTFVGRMFKKAAGKLKMASVDRFLGAAVGAVKGVLVAGVLLYAAYAVLKQSGHTGFIDDSVFAGTVMQITAAVLGVLSEGIR